MTGTTISHYRILEKLGGGGMGVVYKAEDTALHRFVALKFLAPEGQEAHPATPLPPDVLQRFQREARAAAALNHPNICTIYEIGEHQGRLFIAMELVEGETLAARMKAGPIPVEQAVQVARQIAEALEEAHEHHIIHRDLKPANVMLTSKGRVKILDFGLAKLVEPINSDAPTDEDILRSRTGLVMGTVPYMSPEQLRGNPVDMRTDIYSFGAVLYEAATGQRPFPGIQSTQLVAAILTASPPLPHELNREIPAGLENVILKALARDPAARYQSAQELLADLPAAGQPGSGSGQKVVLEKAADAGTRPAGGEIRAPRAGARRSLTLVVGAVLALAILGSLLLLLIPALRRQARAPRLAAGGSLPSRMELAVLPFSVIGGGTSDQAFSRGLAEALTAKLTQLSEGQSLQVVPVGDLLAQHIASARDAAKVFGANLVLTGSLEYAGHQVRVTYALVDPATDRQLRAQMMTLGVANPFGIEDQVVEGTVKMLGIPVAPAERQAMESHGTQAALAFQDYLRGLGYMQNYVSTGNLEKAVESFRSALKADSTYALAYAGLGQAYWHKYQQTSDTAWVDQAQQACGHAVTLDPKLPASHLCLGTLESGTGHYAKAIQEFQRVLQVEPTNIAAFSGLGSAQERLKQTDQAEETYRRAISVRPNYWAPYNWLAIIYFQNGQTEKAAEMFRKVTELAPGNQAGFYNLGATDFMLGKWAEAEEMLKRSIAIQPSAAAYSNLGTVVFYEGHYEESANYFRKAIAFTPKDPQLWGNLADSYKWSKDEKAKAVPTYLKAAELVREGLNVNPSSYEALGKLATYEAQASNIGQALRYLARALPLAPKDPTFSYNAALTYHLADRQGKALDYLRQAVRLGYPVQALRADPEWQAMRNNPEFQKVIAAGNK